MWRFLNSIPRAFRQYIHSPRPSAGVYNFDEDDQSVAESDTNHVCPFSGKSTCLVKKYFNRLMGLSVDEYYSKQNGCYERCKDTSSTEENERQWWQSYQRDFWAFVENSNRAWEAIALGTVSAWGTETDGQKRKLRLLYRVLWAAPGASGKTRFGIRDEVLCEPCLEESARTHPSESTSSTAPHPIHRAIKDAEGAAHDAKVNETVSETLDSALEEFQGMCEEYTRRNESLLGLSAAERGDMELAVHHLQTSCMLGNSSACFNLGLCYETGSGVMQDIDKAKLYYDRAAKSGHSLALYNLGLIYISEQCESKEQASKTVDQEGLTTGKDAGLHLLEKAAKAGLAEAQTYMGIYHMEEDDNPKKAASYFRAAADQNDTEAQYFLGICYEHGLGVEKNECRAAQLYSLSAGAGHETALYNLAVFNENGLGGLPVDMVTATELYTKAAKLGVEPAKVRLEEIQSQSKAYQVNESAFESLYQVYSKEERVHSMGNRPLSPSASSPTLSQYWGDDLPFYPYKNAKKTNSEKKRSFFDPGGPGSLSDGPVRFWLGTDEDDVIQSSILEDTDRQSSLHSPSHLHKSITSPSLAYFT